MKKGGLEKMVDGFSVPDNPPSKIKNGCSPICNKGSDRFKNL